MDTQVISVDTSTRRVVDLTRDLRRFVTQRGGGDGLANVFVPHSTAGVAIMETGSNS